MTAPKMKAKKSSSVQRKSIVKPRSRVVGIDMDLLRKSVQKGAATPVYIVAGHSKIRIPIEKVPMVIEVIENKIVSCDEVLTTQEVADLLNVSRPFVIKLIDQKELPLAFMAGSQRRILKSSALEYRDKMRRKQNDALEALTEESEDLEMDF
ncbi:MAG: helix-turn-helix domain-containing protein [Bdellovibrio sp.]